VAARVMAARRTYSTEKEEAKEGEAKDENAEKIASLESKIKELEVSTCLPSFILWLPISRRGARHCNR
jgi:hypothetical protein